MKYQHNMINKNAIYLDMPIVATSQNSLGDLEGADTFTPSNKATSLLGLIALPLYNIDPKILAFSLIILFNGAPKNTQAFLINMTYSVC